MILTAAIGATVAWSVNYNKYAHRDAALGPITLDGRVNAANAMSVLAENYTESLPTAEIVGESTHDFGVMRPEEEGKHTFVVRNTGKAKLTLALGATTCKCTLGELGKETLEPGEETEILLSWTVKTNEDFFQQTAEVRTNDPVNMALRLQVSGKVVRKISLVPEAWTFGEIAAGESFEIRGKVFSYYEEEVVPTKQSFSSKELTKLSEFDVQPFTPSEADGVHAAANQGFDVVANVKPGMRQGAVSVDYIFGFQRKDKNGQIVRPDKEDSDGHYYSIIDVAGRIVGPLSMITGTKLRAASGSYIYDFGRLGKDDSLKAKAFVVLKGSEREKTKLRIGQITPAEAIQAKLGDPISRGEMVLYLLELEIIPGDKPLDYRGNNRTDFGSIWIESDNPNVAKMRLAVKFAVDPRP